MAEGGVPAEEPRPQVEEVDSLHLLFVRDLINHVLRRKVPAWTFCPEYANPCPVTPFSYRIRNAVDYYLNKECVNFESLFQVAFMDEPIDYDGYIRVFKFTVRSVYHQVKSYTDILRLVFLLSQFTLLAYERGVPMAPYYALFNMKDLLSMYTTREKIHPDYFYGTLGPKAVELIHEDIPIVFHGFNRR